MNLYQVLKFEEGYREKVYHCSEGYPTIGIGTKLGPKNAPLSNYTLTVSEPVANELLIQETYSALVRLKQEPWFNCLDHDRQIIIQSMCYQIGYMGVMKFKNMIAALIIGDYDGAAIQALDSRWAKQTPKRAHRHADVLRHGSLDDVYGGLV